MQIPVLPRDVAGSIITSAVSRMGWAVGAVTLVLTVPVLIETLSRRDRIDDLPVPLAMLGLMLIGICIVFGSGRPWSVFLFLAVAGAAAVVYDLALLIPDPRLFDEAFFLISRPAVALVTVGVTAVSPLIGVLWATLGYGVAWVVTVVVAAVADVPVRIGPGPSLVYGLAVVGYLTLAGIQIAQRRSLPDFDALEAETQRLALGEDLARKTTAAVHDTVLNDLSLVMNAPETLSRPARERLLEDLATLRSAEWLDSTNAILTGNSADMTLRNNIMRILSDFQWRGLNVHVTGFGGGIYRLEPDVANAVLGALRACFENVLRHSGVNTAELEIVYSDATVTLMVTDQGRGFDPQAVPDDRLGLRGSVMDRLRAIGGRVEVWTAPGEGTSVVMTAPAHEVTAARVDTPPEVDAETLAEPPAETAGHDQ